MKRILFAATVAIAPTLAIAQSALDAYQLGQSDLRGTARFMSMGGAFTALGGDLTSLNQNPGGIGVYRSSEIGATLDINFQKTSTTDPGYPNNNHTQTKASCNNFGYVGSIYLGKESVMPFFNWGASYSRVASFDRRYQGAMTLPTSLSNYVAANTTLADGYTPGALNDYTSGYNPYIDSSAPWMSILMYNAYGINPINPGDSSCDAYKGLWQDGTSGVGQFDIEEKGYIDEYSINFGGNFVNMVYWGIGFGITDISYTQRAWYAESLNDAAIPNTLIDSNGNSIAYGTVTGDGAIDIDSWKQITGTGFNFKAGVIIRPINEFRIGAAIHTPTYYKLTSQTYSSMGYSFPSTGFDNPSSNWTETDGGYINYTDWSYRSPWRFMVGAAGVIGGRAILSVDYEYKAFGDMHTAPRGGDEFTDINTDIKNYYQSTNTVRVGAEYRVSNNVSLRAGFVYETSPVKSGVNEGEKVIYTDGPYYTETTPSYSMDNTNIYGTCGIGYHYKNFYIDAAYVHRHRKSTFHAFDTYDINYLQPADVPASYAATPTSEVTDNNNSLVVSLGFRF